MGYSGNVNESAIGPHWEQIFASRAEPERSWTEPAPLTSLTAIAALGSPDDAPIVDIGGGASRLVDHLLEAGRLDITVVDISRTALSQARARVGHDAPVEWIEADITEWCPTRRYAIWHDRAVFHFLHRTADLEHYRDIARDGIVVGGHLVMGTFAPDGPESCSGLPVRRWSATELALHFADGFELESSAVVDHRTPSGGTQPFTWVTLRRSA